MASNSFGNIFKITTWGESHGKAIGVVIDGCPAGLDLNEDDVNQELSLRAPGKLSSTSPRKEKDHAEILSGLFEGKTTGAPISIIIYNNDADSSRYEPIKDLLRPGHANYTYLEKFGIFDYRGGGRSSARETACRVAAGAVAKKLIAHYDIQIVAYIKQVSDVLAEVEASTLTRKKVYASTVYCPDEKASSQIVHLIEQVKIEKNSLGGVVEFSINNLPTGLGDPVYEKLEANLAKAMLSLPATKGFEIGSGFNAIQMKGSEHNDIFVLDDVIKTKTNHAGGVLGGISTGMPLVARVAFKPTSSVSQTMETLNTNKEKAFFNLPENSRHDPCVAIRAVPVVEAMAALVIADTLLMNRSARVI
jgi:chorismate synthase